MLLLRQLKLPLLPLRSCAGELGLTQPGSTGGGGRGTQNRTEFLQNPQLHGPKIQALFVWSCPAADHSLISLLPSLKLVSNGGAGTDHLDVPLITSRGVKVTNTPGAVSNSTADMAMAVLLASARRIVESKAVGATYCLRLDELLTRADLVVLAISLTPDTTGLISHREVSLMKPEATLVNISGGLVLDQDALVEALQFGTICAAALDVTHP
ncbi:unnamed protein product [Pleuronectes platessa]|uniref:D-isomer specific 2-hydroxyacid dehydrogenase NAD-binding domain-containing protein n=1 Tax=Pleuronectes platessa TaxID=8262 RepID=A0A9N7YHB9_PLEPL|nr:unnamed protein product [Pleuronectes platessa]